MSAPKSEFLRVVLKRILYNIFHQQIWFLLDDLLLFKVTKQEKDPKKILTPSVDGADLVFWVSLRSLGAQLVRLLVRSWYLWVSSSSASTSKACGVQALPLLHVCH